MYENVNVEEPTCPGWWFCIERLSQRGTPRIRVVQVRTIAGEWHSAKHSLGPWNPIFATDRWTGPIASPEEKPIPSEDEDSAQVGTGNDKREAHYPGLSAEECRRRGLAVSSAGVPPASADEGEKWGRVLADIHCAEYGATTPALLYTYDDLSCAMRGVQQRTALRFRAECVKEFEEVVRAARAYLGVMGGDGTDGDGFEEYHDLEVALSDLPAKMEKDA